MVLLSVAFIRSANSAPIVYREYRKTYRAICGANSLPSAMVAAVVLAVALAVVVFALLDSPVRRFFFFTFRRTGWDNSA